jgi:hypothetical protein
MTDSKEDREYTDRQGEKRRHVEDREEDQELPVVGGDPADVPPDDPHRQTVSPDPAEVERAKRRKDARQGE